jgi:hypothetical protein
MAYSLSNVGAVKKTAAKSAWKKIHYKYFLSTPWKTHSSSFYSSSLLSTNED